VPGLDVAQINSHEWAVSARGFNTQFANQLLVLLDGRSIYGTGFGGVVWGVQDVVMEDIDRIEVIRGPGAALWGANAVNGVINIITKNARETQGTLVSVTGGTLDQPITTVRYGGQLATNLFYRVYGKFSNRDGLETASGQDAPDRTLTAQGGGRLDWEPSDENKFTLQGDMYRDRFVENQDLASLLPPYLLNLNEVEYNSGANALGRWTHDFSDTSSLTIQTYYDRFKQEQAGAVETTDTIDFDAQHRFALGSRNDITWGLGYRNIDDAFQGSPFVTWNPASERDRLFSSFVQDEISLVPDRLKLTLGSKFEHNDINGFEYEPSGRLLWTPTERQTVWAAISRAVSTPSWSFLHSTANLLVIPPMPPVSPLPVQISSFGNPNLDDEVLIAYELGYRIEVTKHLSFDVAGFYNNYDDLIGQTPVTTSIAATPVPHALVGSTEENAGSGHTYGVEISGRWDVTDHWHLTASYSWLDIQLGFASTYLQSSPKQQAQLGSSLDLPYHFELNGAVSFVDQITAPYGIGEMNIPSYVRLDLGVVWHATKNLEFGVWGQNLAQDRHEEFTSYKTLLVTEIPRSVVARITFRF
jgi:iron complex outermembrane receptor protein